jgi:WD40 repeat protein
MPKIEVVPQIGHSVRVRSVGFSPDRRQALSGSEDNTLKLWDAASGTLLRTFSTWPHPPPGLVAIQVF